MKYALNLAADDRYLSSSDSSIWCPTGAPVVDFLPTGETESEQNLHNWRYVDGTWIFDPLPDDPAEAPEDTDSGSSVWDELDAAYQAGYDEGYMEGVNGAYDQ